jgi:hypothetical protein
MFESYRVCNKQQAWLQYVNLKDRYMYDDSYNSKLQVNKKLFITDDSDTDMEIIKKLLLSLDKSGQKVRENI